jgi:hypothetical protein
MSYRSKELVVTFTIASILSALPVTSADAHAAARKTAGPVNSEIALDVSVATGQKK